jgi:DNA-binding transcriptional ArsR family regulator
LVGREPLTRTGSFSRVCPKLKMNDPTRVGPTVFPSRRALSITPLDLFDFEITPSGRFQRLSARFPMVRWTVRPFGDRWLVNAEGPQDDLEAISAAGQSGLRLTHAAPESMRFLYRPNKVEDRLVADLLRGGVAIVPPLHWFAGRLTVRLTSFRTTLPVEWSASHREARLVRKQRTEPMALLKQSFRLGEGIPAPTRRQSLILLEAVKMGYYDTPRRSKVRDIARAFGIARSTAEEHLRAAESAMVRSIVPFVAARNRFGMSADTRSPDLLERFARYGAELDILTRYALHEDLIPLVSHELKGNRQAWTSRTREFSGQRRTGNRSPVRGIENQKDLDAELGRARPMGHLRGGSQRMERKLIEAYSPVNG